MTIKQVSAAKAEAERQIEAIVDQFVRETGARVTGLDVGILKYEHIAGRVQPVCVRATLRVEVF